MTGATTVGSAEAGGRRRLAGVGLAGVGLAATLLLCLSAASAQAAAAAADPALVGTWRLLRFEDTDAKGQLSKPLGEHPAGYIVYDATGHLSVQLMQTPAQPPFAPGAGGKGTDAEVRRAYTGYLAYFGTYRVDAARHIVTHVIEGGLSPSNTGTEQPRAYRVTGDTLVLEIHSPNGAYAYRELERMR
jgi:hypothetical protein